MLNPHTQVFEYTFYRGGLIIWNIDKAKELIAQGKFVTELPIEPEQMRIIVERYDSDPAHYDDVDPSIPGISAPIINDDGSIIYVLIDGIHRCGRAFRDGLGFSARFLSDEDSRSCILYISDPRLIP